MTGTHGVTGSQASADPPLHVRERIAPVAYTKGPHDEANVPRRPTGAP